MNFLSLFSVKRLPHRLPVLFFFLAFALHALVPLGYMPDFSGHSEGVFSVEYCDGVDHSAHASHHHHHGGNEKPCPFSFGTTFTPITLALPPIVPEVFAEAVSLPALPAPSLSSIAFSNASPRSPPLFS